MNRREFIKSVMAAAVAAHIPDFTVAEAEAAYDACGITDMGNGWYRCWIHFDKKLDDSIMQGLSAGDYNASVFAKAGDALHGKRDGKIYRNKHMVMRAGRVEVYFDLETGKIGKASVVPDGRELLAFESPDVYLYGAQLEVGELKSQYIATNGRYQQ